MPRTVRQEHGEAGGELLVFDYEDDFPIPNVTGGLHLVIAGDLVHVGGYVTTGAGFTPASFVSINLPAEAAPAIRNVSLMLTCWAGSSEAMYASISTGLDPEELPNLTISHPAGTNIAPSTQLEVGGSYVRS